MHSPEPIETSFTLPSTSFSPPESTSSPSPLSPKQVQEILCLVTTTLEKDVRITLELLHYLRDPCSSTKTSSSTPTGHPVLLSSDKMSNTAPNHMRYTVQQLSQYYGFRSFKNWDVLYDVCQPNFSFIQPSDPPLKSNIKKAWCNKTLVEHPPHFLEVVHCDIGFGDCKSVGNGALYCLILVDRATCYSWIYPMKSLHHDSIKSTFQQWLIDCVGVSFPSLL
jgi:hypothetical protein